MALLNNGVKSYNPNTLTPPVIYLKGEKIGCLSKNVNLTNRVDLGGRRIIKKSQRLFD